MVNFQEASQQNTLIVFVAIHNFVVVSVFRFEVKKIAIFLRVFFAKPLSGYVLLFATKNPFKAAERNFLDGSLIDRFIATSLLQL